MALILLCGRPSSGKTTVSLKLQSLLEESGRSVSHITDPLPHPPLFTSSTTEKTQRQRLRATTERSLLPNHFALCDSLNYIKGMRYELFCAAKTSGIRYCVIYCDLEETECRGLGGDWGGLMGELCARFEEPHEKNRWDSPLYRINVLREGWEAAVEGVRDWLVNEKSNTLVASMATRLPNKQGADVLGLLDSVTRQVETCVISAIQAGKSTGDSISVPDISGVIRLQRKPKVAELRAMRRSYLNLARAQAPSAVDAVSLKEEYVAFVNEQLRGR